MNITQAFILRLAEMPENECSQFLKLHKAQIDFPQLVIKAREMLDQQLAAGENNLAEKIQNVIEDTTLFTAEKQLPAGSVIPIFNL